MVPPIVNFGPKLQNCHKLPSLLMTHNSTQVTRCDLACKPFCQVPQPCKFEAAQHLPWFNRIRYIFSCHCLYQTCTDLFLMLQPELDRVIFEICHISLFWNLWNNLLGSKTDTPLFKLVIFTKYPLLFWLWHILPLCYRVLFNLLYIFANFGIALCNGGYDNHVCTDVGKWYGQIITPEAFFLIAWYLILVSI